MIIVGLFKTSHVDPKALKSLLEAAKSTMQSTKAAMHILVELFYGLKNKKLLYTIFQDSELSIEEYMKADEIEGNPKERFENFQKKN